MSLEMKDMTSKGSVKSISEIIDKKVHETATCHCGKEYSRVYSMNFGKERKTITAKECDYCSKEKQEQEWRNEWLAEQRVSFLKGIKETFEEKSLLNDKLKIANFETYHPTNDELKKAKEICVRYAHNFNTDNPVSLLLIGNYGTGKSHLAVSIAKELVEKGISTIFISTPKLLSQLRSTYNKGSHETEEQILKRLMRVNCLIVDDIGSEQTKKRYDDNEHDWGTSKIFELIDSRIGKHTIYTSNFKPNELQERLGGRNFSRMMEGTHVIKMNGDDYRLRDFK